MNPLTPPEPETKKIPGDPCTVCGCPYPGDHTQECTTDMRIEKRLKSAEHDIAVIAKLIQNQHEMFKIVRKLMGELSAAVDILNKR